MYQFSSNQKATTQKRKMHFQTTKDGEDLRSLTIAKAKLEVSSEGKVSCDDILAFAARGSILII